MTDLKHILALPPEKRDDEIRKLIVPKPWKHDWVNNICMKCDITLREHTKLWHKKRQSCPSFCPIPDPIPLDWNLAMRMRDEVCATAIGRVHFEQALKDIYLEVGSVRQVFGLRSWAICHAQPCHYILAALKCKEKE